MGYFRTCHLGLLAVVFANIGHAQHYTPEVCLHDAAQRMFPVEAARAMAWMENQKSDRIGEVTWQVAGQIDGRCEWRIGWKSRQGDEIASATVTYNATQLSAGPGYFRDVWSQLAKGLHFESGHSAAAAKELEAAFWRGSARAEVTRMSAVVNAQTRLNQSHPRSNAQDATELAGMLAQGAVPILGGSCTLDYLMLARAAAWLCHAETLTGTALIREWCVISHLAGREIPASRAWEEAKEAATHDAPVWRWWDLILTNYPAPVKNVCLFATKPGQAETGLPFILSYLRYETGASKSLENILAELYGQKLLSQPDHAPLLMESFLMGRMRQTCFQMAQRNQREWLELLTLQRQPGADEHSRMAADAADAALAAMSNDEGKEVPILGLAATGKVVELGAKAHHGPLRPQAVVSCDELLMHGWESSMQVWRQVYEFFDYRMGIPEVAVPLLKAARTAAPSLAATMVSRNQKAPEAAFPLAWLEYLEDPKIGQIAIYQKGRGRPETGAPGLAIQFIHNCMRRGPLAFNQWCTLFPSISREIHSDPLIEMVMKQGSENTVSYACKFYHVGISEHFRERFKQQGVTLFERTRKACPNALLLQRNLLAEDLKKSAMPALEVAQKMEAHYWLAPGDDHIDFVMEKYVEARAPEAAARFYAEALEIDGGSIKFSNTEAPMRWALAWLEGDKAGMVAADKNASSYSSVDLEKNALHALCAGDLNRARKACEACLQRYGPGPRGASWLLTLLPLLDALKDENHRQHLEAQSYFLRGGEYPHMQFVVLRELGVANEDCIKLMTLSETRDYAALLLSCWQGNAAFFQKNFDALTPFRRNHMPAMFKMILAHLNAELHKRPKATPADLKPAQETRLDELVRQAMKERAAELR